MGVAELVGAGAIAPEGVSLAAAVQSAADDDIVAHARRPGALVGITRRSVLQLATVPLLAALPGSCSLAPRSRGAAARVVIVGGGFAGSACALQLRRLEPALRVTLIDPDATYVTCPMSNAVLGGLRSFESLEVGRAGIRRAGVEYLHDAAVAIDPDKRIVRTGSGRQVAYDRLIMATGIRFLWGTPEGYDLAAAQVMPHAWIAGEQTRLLARQLQSMRDGGVVLISVPRAPLRCPPGPFERASLMAAWLSQHRPKSKILIFDANNNFPRQDVFESAWQRLYPGMISWVPVVEGGMVTRVDTREMAIYTDTGRHAADVINLIPPQAPTELAVQAGLAQERGWCPIDPHTFQSQNVPHIHVIGDACIAAPMPKSGSAAVAQAARCAAGVVADLAGKQAPDEEMHSVCYSLLTAGEGLSIPGRFRVTEQGVHQIPPEPGPVPSATEEAQHADDWYRKIRATAFGA